MKWLGLGMRGRRAPRPGSAEVPAAARDADTPRAGAASPARGAQLAEDVRTPTGGGEERPGRQPPAAAPRLPESKPQDGSEGGRTADRDLQRGCLSRSPRTAPPVPGMGDRGAQHERAALQSPGAPEGAAAAVNGLLHNGFHPPAACSRDPPPPRFQLPSELQPQPQPLPQPQPQPLFAQHDSPAKKCRLRRRMDSGRKNRPRKSCRQGSAGARGRGGRQSAALDCVLPRGVGRPRWRLASPIRLMGRADTSWSCSIGHRRGKASALPALRGGRGRTPD